MEDQELSREDDRLRREIRHLKEERDILKKQGWFSLAKSHELQIYRKTLDYLLHRSALSDDGS